MTIANTTAARTQLRIAVLRRVRLGASNSRALRRAFYRTKLTRDLDKGRWSVCLHGDVASHRHLEPRAELSRPPQTEP
jgi:hypothetical protein